MIATTTAIIKNTESFMFRSSRPEVFIGKGVLKICSKFTGEHPWMAASVC